MVTSFPPSKEAALAALEICDNSTRSRLKIMADLVTLDAGSEVPPNPGLYVMFRGSIRIINGQGSSTILQAPCVLDAASIDLDGGRSIVIAAAPVTALAFDRQARELLFGSAPRVNALALDSARLLRLFKD